LHIITDKPEEYVNDDATLCTISPDSLTAPAYEEKNKKAYSLFVHGETSKAMELLKSKEKWLISYVSAYFRGLPHVSVTSLKESAYDYFIEKILRLESFSKAAAVGTSVHDVAEQLISGNKVHISDDLKPFTDNVSKVLAQIKEKYPTALEPEFEIDLPLSKLISTKDEIKFFGYIDAVFTDGSNYLIVDWKTDRDTKNDSKHRQQLESYRRAYSMMKGIPLDKIKVAIAFIGLRSRINTGEVLYLLDERQPGKTAFDTFTKKVNLLLGWRADIKLFFDKMIEEDKRDDVIWRSVVEQYNLEHVK
jgi:DNA helicase-2/ATP-dependent DNA helicase PcrA